jgi:hypothetical protein
MSMARTRVNVCSLPLRVVHSFGGRDERAIAVHLNWNGACALSGQVCNMAQHFMWTIQTIHASNVTAIAIIHSIWCLATVSIFGRIEGSDLHRF